MFKKFLLGALLTSCLSGPVTASDKVNVVLPNSDEVNVVLPNKAMVRCRDIQVEPFLGHKKVTLTGIDGQADRQFIMPTQPLPAEAGRLKNDLKS